MSAPNLQIVGDTDARIWGLPAREWQRRTFRKAGATGQGADTIAIDVNKALSPNLVRALVDKPDTVLVDDAGVVVAARGVDCAHLVGTRAEGQSMRTVADTYNLALRKTEDPYIFDLRDDDPDVIMRRQFASSYKGITDFVTKWIWPVPAYHVTRWAADRRLTPNQVTTIGFVLCIVAFFAFWQGAWWIGFATGWTMTFLDTVDGKLARTTMTYSKWGNVYDHGIDLVHPPFWYWAWWHGLGVTLAAKGLDAPDWLTLALWVILVGYVVDRIVEGAFMRLYDMHIHVWTRANSAMRFVIARRNPNTFIFMLGILATAIWPLAGAYAFGAVAAWTVFGIAFNCVTLAVSLFARKPLVSWMDRDA